MYKCINNYNGKTFLPLRISANVASSTYSLIWGCQGMEIKVNCLITNVHYVLIIVSALSHKIRWLSMNIGISRGPWGNYFCLCGYWKTFPNKDLLGNLEQNFRGIYQHMLWLKRELIYIRESEQLNSPCNVKYWIMVEDSCILVYITAVRERDSIWA